MSFRPAESVLCNSFVFLTIQDSLHQTFSTQPTPARFYAEAMVHAAPVLWLPYAYKTYMLLPAKLKMCFFRDSGETAIPESSCIWSACGRSFQSKAVELCGPSVEVEDLEEVRRFART
jgi:hypothetical protein